MDPTDVSPDTDRRMPRGQQAGKAAELEAVPVDARLTKDREMQSRLLAQSVVNQLVESGYGIGDLLNLVSEVLRAVNEHPSNNSGPQADEDEIEDGRQRLLFRYEEADRPDALRISGPRVCLRPIVPADQSVLRAWLKEEAIRATFSELTLTEVVSHTESLLHDPTRWDFLICLGDRRPIGMVCLHQIDPDVRQAEMTKLLGDPGARGHGYALEATLLLLAYAFEVLNLERVYLQTAGFNMRNIRLNEQIGFRYEGVLRQAARLADGIADVVLMGILASDYRQRYRAVTDG